MSTTTSSPTLTESDSGESHRVLSWRLSVLQRAGYPIVAAGLLATTSRVDLHQAADLLGRGCSYETALRILL